MKKILLTILAAGLVATTAYSQEAPFELYEGDYNDSKLIKISPEPDEYGDIAPLTQWSGNLRGVAYHSDAIADNNFSDGGELVYYLEASTIQGTGPGQLNGSPYDNNGYAVTAGFYSVTEGNVYNSDLGKDEWGPALRPVVKSNTYKGAPIILNVHAEQNDYNESKDVIIEYYLLLGQDRGEAFIEYWYRSDYSPLWVKLDPSLLDIEGSATGEGLTPKSGAHYTMWQAGVQLGNQVKTSNAQIRVTANYGGPSGWDGNGEFNATTGGGGNAESGVYELFDTNDPHGVGYWDEFSPEGYASSVQKRDSILIAAGLVSVGTYDDGVQEYPVYDFTGMESFRDQFATGLTGHFLFTINDTNIIRVQLQTNTGN